MCESACVVAHMLTLSTTTIPGIPVCFLSRHSLSASMTALLGSDVGQELSTAFCRMRVMHRGLREWRQVVTLRHELRAVGDSVQEARWRRCARWTLRLLAKSVGFRKLRDAALQEADSIFLIPWVVHLRGRTIKTRRMRLAYDSVLAKRQAKWLQRSLGGFRRALTAGRVIDGAVSSRLVAWLARVLAVRWMRGWRCALVVGHWARRRRLKT